MFSVNWPAIFCLCEGRVFRLINVNRKGNPSSGYNLSHDNPAAKFRENFRGDRSRDV